MRKTKHEFFSDIITIALNNYNIDFNVKYKTVTYCIELVRMTDCCVGLDSTMDIVEDSFFNKIIV